MGAHYTVLLYCMGIYEEPKISSVNGEQGLKDATENGLKNHSERSAWSGRHFPHPRV